MSTFSSSRAQHVGGLGDVAFAVGAPLGDHRLDLRVLARVQRLEGEVLELPLERVDAEPVRERRVDLERLPRLLDLLLLAEVLDRAEVVEAVGELDEDDAHVLGHRHDHLPVVLGLRLLAGLELDARQLRDAVDERGDLVAELLAQRRRARRRCPRRRRGGARRRSSARRGAGRAQIAATPTGCVMNGSPERRCWPSCAAAAKRKARVTSSTSTSARCAASSASSASRSSSCLSPASSVVTVSVYSGVSGRIPAGGTVVIGAK